MKEVVTAALAQYEQRLAYELKNAKHTEARHQAALEEQKGPLLLLCKL